MRQKRSANSAKDLSKDICKSLRPRQTTFQSVSNRYDEIENLLEPGFSPWILCEPYEADYREKEIYTIARRVSAPAAVGIGIDGRWNAAAEPRIRDGSLGLHPRHA